jgi:hypothetical protein
MTVPLLPTTQTSFAPLPQMAVSPSVVPLGESTHSLTMPPSPVPASAGLPASATPAQTPAVHCVAPVHALRLAAYWQAPAVQVPLAAGTSRALVDAQLVAGGLSQTRLAQGSSTQAPPLQPFTQRVSRKPYSQAPLATQLPSDAKTLNVVPSTQLDGGGCWQDLPAHGSLTQAPFSQPPVHAVSVVA